MRQDPRKMKPNSREKSDFINEEVRMRNNLGSQTGKIKLILAILVVIAAALAYWFWSKKSVAVETNPLVTIVAVTPNYSSIKIPSQSCKIITTSKSVKNPNSGFFSSMFDSKNHPKYIKQSSSKQVCQEVYIESQVVNNYTISYRFKHYVESMVVQTPPQLNQTMLLTDLQKYQQIGESAGVVQTQKMNSVTK